MIQKPNSTGMKLTTFTVLRWDMIKITVVLFILPLFLSNSIKCSLR